MASIHEDITWTPPITTYNDLAELELRKLEDIDGTTTLPVAFVLARGFAALAYAVLAVRETCEDQGADVGNAIADVASAAADTAVNVAELADAAAAAPWWRRLAWRVQFTWRTRAARPGKGPAAVMSAEPVLTAEARAYEGYVVYADGRRVSLQCFEGRHGECPDTVPAGQEQPAYGPLDGCNCECSGCPGHHPGQSEP